MKKYGTPSSPLLRLRKGQRRRRWWNNPLALFRKEVTAEDVMNDQ